MNNLFCKLTILSFVFTFFCMNAANAEIRDTFAEEYFAGKTIEKPAVNLDYNYESVKKLPVRLKIEKKISTGKNSDIYEGQKVNFKVLKSVKYGGITLVKAGTIGTATIETFSGRGMNGVPASLVLNNFEIPGLDKNLLGGSYTKKGLSLTIMVLPLKWALTPIPFVGSTTNLILGGNAVLSPDNTFDIYYYPERKQNKG